MALPPAPGSGAPVPCCGEREHRPRKRNVLLRGDQCWGTRAHPERGRYPMIERRRDTPAAGRQEQGALVATHTRHGAVATSDRGRVLRPLLHGARWRSYGSLSKTAQTHPWWGQRWPSARQRMQRRPAQPGASAHVWSLLCRGHLRGLVASSWCACPRGLS